MRLLGDWASPTTAAEIAFTTSREQALANRQDAHAWFNMGTSLTQLGRFEEAATAYDRALEIGITTWRILWYQFDPLETYYQVGRYQDVIALADATFSTQGGRNVEETYWYKGLALESQGQISEAIANYEAALEVNPNAYYVQWSLDALTGG